MRLLLLFLLLSCSVLVYSQYEYRPGYILKKDGQTEEGLINFHGKEFNARKCEFKKDINADPVVYLPGSITAYRLLDSKYFVSKKVRIENVDTIVFLECLISGKATIYFTAGKTQDHYYLEKDGDMVELKNEKTDVEKDGSNYQHSTNQYKGILRYYFRDCPQMFAELNYADFSSKSLIKLSKDYHEYVCKDEKCIVYEKKESKKKIQLGIDFSYGVAMLNFYDIKIQMSSEPKMQYQFGVNSQMNLDEEGAFNLQVALRYYSYKTQWVNGKIYSMPILPDVKHSSDVKYQYSILKPEIQLKYKMKVWKIVPFASAGVFTNYFLTDKGVVYNERLNTTILFNSGGVEEGKIGSMNGMFGGIVEIGLESKLKPGNFSFSLFYERFLTDPYRSSTNIGVRCGYSIWL